MNDGILCRGTQHKHTIDLKKVVPVVSLIVSINIIHIYIDTRLFLFYLLDYIIMPFSIK